MICATQFSKFKHIMPVVWYLGGRLLMSTGISRDQYLKKRFPIFPVSLSSGKARMHCIVLRCDTSLLERVDILTMCIQLPVCSQVSAYQSSSSYGCRFHFWRLLYGALEVVTFVAVKECANFWVFYLSSPRPCIILVCTPATHGKCISL